MPSPCTDTARAAVEPVGRSPPRALRLRAVAGRSPRRIRGSRRSHPRPALELGEERRGLGRPELLGPLASRAQLHLHRHELLLGAAVERVLQLASGGVGGGEHTLAGCFEFGDLAAQLAVRRVLRNANPSPDGEVGQQCRLGGGHRFTLLLRQRQATEQLAVVEHRQRQIRIRIDELVDAVEGPRRQRRAAMSTRSGTRRRSGPTAPRVAGPRPVDDQLRDTFHQLVVGELGRAVREPHQDLVRRRPLAVDEPVRPAFDPPADRLEGDRHQSPSPRSTARTRPRHRPARRDRRRSRRTPRR